MRPVLPLLSLCFSLACRPTAVPADIAADEDAVRRVLARSARDLETHNWADYAQLWAHEPAISVVHPGGREWIDGWDSVANKYRALIADTSWHITSRTVRQDVHVAHSRDMAWLTEQDTLHLIRGGVESTVLQWSTAILEKRNGAWRLVHAHASQIPLAR